MWASPAFSVDAFIVSTAKNFEKNIEWIENAAAPIIASKTIRILALRGIFAKTFDSLKRRSLIVWKLVGPLEYLNPPF